MPTKPKIRAVRALEAIEPPRPVVTRLSEADEAVDKFGHTSFRVRDQPFVVMGEGPDGNGSMTIETDGDAA